jgi:hypothetical protein
VPIDTKEFNDGKSSGKLEDEIVHFLSERREQAFTSREVMGGLDHFRPDFTIPDLAQMSAFSIADFTTLLHDLVKKGRISMRIVAGQMYFLTPKANTIDGVRCPKCGSEIAVPRKTWKMARRPNKEGKRTQFLVGLFECPEHGVFRRILSRQSI